MGVVENVGHDRFPKQGSHKGLRAQVMFNYSSPTLGGVIIRDDAEAPWETIIQLDDGRIVRATECQYSPFT